MRQGSRVPWSADTLWGRQKLQHEPTYTNFCGSIGCAVQEAKDWVHMHGDILSERGLPLDATVRGLSSQSARWSFSATRTRTRERLTPYLATTLSPSALNKKLASPNQYLCLVLELQAARMTAGIPPPRLIVRPNGERIKQPTIDYAERIARFSEARIMVEPDTYLPAAMRQANFRLPRHGGGCSAYRANRGDRGVAVHAVGVALRRTAPLELLHDVRCLNIGFRVCDTCSMLDGLVLEPHRFFAFAQPPLQRLLLAHGFHNPLLGFGNCRHL